MSESPIPPSPRESSGRPWPPLRPDQLGVTLYSIGDAVIVTDVESRVTFMNPVAEALTGWKGEEAVGQPLDAVFQIINEVTRLAVESPVLRALREGAVVGLANHTLLVAKDGSERAIDDSAAPIRDENGEMVGVVLVFRDVTQQRALQLAQARLAAIVASSDDAIVSKTLDGIILSWNHGAERLFGYSAAEAVGQSIHLVIPQELHDEEREILSRLRRGERIDHFETVRVTKSGRHIEISLTISPIRNEHGEVVAASKVARDITGRKEAARALELSENRYRAIVEGQSELICRYRPDGTILFANGAYARRWGKSPEELIGLTFWKLVPEEEQPRIRQMIAKLSPAAPQVQIENLIETSQGPRWHLWTNRALEFDREGSAIEVQASGIDIHDRKVAEEALRKHSEETHILLETLPIGVYITRDPQCTQITANPAGYELLRMKAEGEENVSLSGPTGNRPEHFHVFREDRELEPHDLPVQRAARGERVTDEEVEVRFDDGAVVSLLMSAAPLNDDAGGAFGAVAVAQDITQRRRLEHSLQFLAEASKSLSTLVDYKSTLQQVARLAVPDFADWCAVDLLNEDQTLERLAVAHIDPAKEQLAAELHKKFQHDPENPTGALRVALTRKGELTSEITWEMIQQVVHDEEQLRILRELELKSYMCVPLTAKGITRGAITFVSAESGRRYGPEDLAMAVDLANRAAIAIENARLYQELREADRRKNEFLAMLAHELRNPLAPIRSGLDILAMEEDCNREAIGLMQEQVQHLVRLVDDLLDVSRIMQGRIELRKERVELAALVHRAADAVQSLVGAHEQKLVVQVAEEPIWLYADPVRMVQVLENLLNNAFKYTDPGGRVELTAKRDANKVVIQVRDTGIGIEPEFLNNVFELFTQSSRSLDRSQGGLGIGLTLVKRLVELHDGSVAASSEGLGKGSCFTVRLPMAQEAPALEEKPESSGAVRELKILVVDDNAGAAKMLSMLLSRIGDHEIEIVYDGPAALAKIKDWRPDLVLLDIGLPGMDGYRVAGAVREIRELDDVALVALTGYGQADDRERSMRAGFNQHLVKPVEKEEIERLLRELPPVR